MSDDSQFSQSPFSLESYCDQERHPFDPPSAPKNFHLVAKSETTSTISLTWNAPEIGVGSVTGYRISFQEAADGVWKQIEIASNKTIHELSNLIAGSKYNVYIQAQCKEGFSSPSTTIMGIQTLERTRLALDVKATSTIKGRVTEGTAFLDMYEPETEITFEQNFIKKVAVGPKRLRRLPIDPIRLLMVGPTGSGKTTTLNSLINYLFGVEIHDNFRFKIVWEGKENNNQGQAHSQTSNITIYTIFDTILKRSVVIIDTPGFGDTRGLKYDSGTLNMIKKLFEGVDLDMSALTAVCFIIKASETRLTATLAYQIGRVSDLFGKDLGQRITPLLTFSDGARAPAIDALKEAEISVTEKIFMFNNSAFFTPAPMVAFWDLGVKCFELFFSKIKTWIPISTAGSASVLRFRQKLEAIAQQLQRQIRNLINEVNTMKQETIILNQIDSEVHANQNFEYEVTEEISEKRKYDDKTSEKISKQELLKRIEIKISENRKKVQETLVELNATLEKLRKEAWRASKCTNVEFIDQLILATESEKKTGWQEYVKELRTQKEIAVIIGAAASVSDSEKLERLLADAVASVSDSDKIERLLADSLPIYPVHESGALVQVKKVKNYLFGGRK
ncbi:hypothetical protein HK100_011422 [Physocladia obscura]|uniref:Fibronectin type-III domain-containing protein n=1 Tax=Physocladia obscura TaxID=109957 RepID=A0AAD5XGM3_9FUNG|nr:hypothetical protein HK100_011422 [Physocladia obscura]